MSAYLYSTFRSYWSLSSSDTVQKRSPDPASCGPNVSFSRSLSMSSRITKPFEGFTKHSHNHSIRSAPRITGILRAQTADWKMPLLHSLMPVYQSLPFSPISMINKDGHSCTSLNSIKCIQYCCNCDSNLLAQRPSLIAIKALLSDQSK